MLNVIKESDELQQALKSVSIFHSRYVENNKDQLLLEIKKAVCVYKNKNNVSDMTWGYKNYNIFNLCVLSESVRQLQKLIHDYIFIFLEELEIKHTGFLIQAWINWHTQKDDMLGKHTHAAPFHGYVAIDPLGSETIFSSLDDDLFSVVNRTGLIYINRSNQFNFHRVELKDNEPLEQPRVTLAFDFIPLPFEDATRKNSTTFNSSFYAVHK